VCQLRVSTFCFKQIHITSVVNFHPGSDIWLTAEESRSRRLIAGTEFKSREVAQRQKQCN